jgi:uncharacterized damage-inducible protein DinB
MISHVRWFEREFALGLPDWMLPNVVERLRGTPARAESLLRDVPRELLTRRDGERWSMQEQVGHLLDLGWLDLARVEDYAAGRDVLTAADLENRRTHAANHNARGLAEVLADFRDERGRFVQLLEEFDEATAARSALHPRLNKRMRVVDFAFFIAEHDDHHLAAIRALMRKFGRRG